MGLLYNQPEGLGIPSRGSEEREASDLFRAVVGTRIGGTSGGALPPRAVGLMAAGYRFVVVAGGTSLSGGGVQPVMAPTQKIAKHPISNSVRIIEFHVLSSRETMPVRPF
jgi:hypothetical protein